VFLARDPRLGRLLAIKLIGEGGDYPDRRKRFEREAQSAAQLSHPNIVTIFDFGEHQDRPFIAMEFVPGETLAAKIAHREEMTFVRKLELMLDLCAGLAHAHRARIVHRDVKPANLMITPEGRLKILDFGIARINDADATRTGTLVGTPNYMAPEQLTGHGADTRTDIFAVGAVFYELVSYRQAFPGTIAGGVLARVLMNEPTPLAELCPDLDPAVALLIRQALEKDPARRPQDLEEMRGAVQAIHQRATHGVPVRGAAPLQEMR
jgi:serine/threonine-protein kinase